MKKRLFLIAVSVLVVSLGPWVIPVFRPWSAINCCHEEINIKTGQARYSGYLWFVRVSERVEDTTLSKVLGGASVDAADIEPWHKVNTFSPGIRHSPHYVFHSALAQVRELELIFEMDEPDAERKRVIVREILRLWQTTGRDGGAVPYPQSLALTDTDAVTGQIEGASSFLLATPAALSGDFAHKSFSPPRQLDPGGRYCQALELHRLLSEQGTDCYTLRERD